MAFVDPATGAKRKIWKLALPTNGTWQNLQLIGLRRSKLDKDAILEVREDRPDGTILGRRALAVLQVPGSTIVSPVVAPATTVPGVEITVGSPATTLDDYVTWSPWKLMIRQPPATSSLPVIVRNMKGSGGRLRFGPDPATLPPGSTVTGTTRSVTLPANGSWVTIGIAGAFGAPSLRDKDAVAEVVRTGLIPPLLAREGLMVRVRRNANALGTDARTRYLRSVATLNLQADQYNRLQHLHRVGNREAHVLSGFLPWHRAFLLELERMMQALDPSVALHYWRFDQPAPNVFDSAFMGVTPSGGTSVVEFTASNPLDLWRVQDATEFGGAVFNGVLRRPNYLPTGQPSLNDEITTLALGVTYALFDDMEGNPHGDAHVQTGGTGNWLRSPSISVRDPLFFMLHSNVDRLWAKWQGTYTRFDPTSDSTYTQQTDPGPGSFTSIQCAQHRSYVNGGLWPWSGVTDASDTCRPNQASTPFRASVVTPASPPQPPRPADVIEYRYAGGLLGNGFGYDDVPHD